MDWCLKTALQDRMGGNFQFPDDLEKIDYTPKGVVVVVRCM